MLVGYNPISISYSSQASFVGIYGLQPLNTLFVRDSNGLVAEKTEDFGIGGIKVTKYYYLSNSRLDKITETIGGQRLITQYTYDANGHEESIFREEVTI